VLTRVLGQPLLIPSIAARTTFHWCVGERFNDSNGRWCSAKKVALGPRHLPTKSLKKMHLTSPHSDQLYEA